MSKKHKFNPVITRVKLNPEQAVLSCQCAYDSWQVSGSFEKANTVNQPGCLVGTREHYYTNTCSAHGTSYVIDSSQAPNDVGS